MTVMDQNLCATEEKGGSSTSWKLVTSSQTSTVWKKSFSHHHWCVVWYNLLCYVARPLFDAEEKKDSAASEAGGVHDTSFGVFSLAEQLDYVSRLYAVWQHDEYFLSTNEHTALLTTVGQFGVVTCWYEECYTARRRKPYDSGQCRLPYLVIKRRMNSGKKGGMGRTLK
jgi:hypothetical protein